MYDLKITPGFPLIHSILLLLVQSQAGLVLGILCSWKWGMVWIVISCLHGLFFYRQETKIQTLHLSSQNEFGVLNQDNWLPVKLTDKSRILPYWIKLDLISQDGRHWQKTIERNALNTELWRRLNINLHN